MKNKIKVFTLTFLFSFFSLVNIVYADTVDISETPQQLATALGLDLLAGQVLLSLIFFCLILFPTMLLTSKYRNQNEAIIFVSILSLGFTVAAGWLSYWFLIVIALIVAFLFSSKMKELITK